MEVARCWVAFPQWALSAAALEHPSRTRAALGRAVLKLAEDCSRMEAAFWAPAAWRLVVHPLAGYPWGAQFPAVPVVQAAAVRTHCGEKALSPSAQIRRRGAVS